MAEQWVAMCSCLLETSLWCKENTEKKLELHLSISLLLLSFSVIFTIIIIIITITIITTTIMFISFTKLMRYLQNANLTTQCRNCWLNNTYQHNPAPCHPSCTCNFVIWSSSKYKMLYTISVLCFVFVCFLIMAVHYLNNTCTQS